ncbi:MAG: sulfatase-like hydrolase/transferase [Myxococcales bacterium]
MATASTVMRASLWCGLGAGLFVAMGDFGATWLWLPVWRDRGSYLWRMLAALGPAGALLATLAGCLGWLAYRGATRVSPSRSSVAWAGALAALSLPGARWLALKLCSGGMMSRLAQRTLIEWTLTLVLPASLGMALYLGLRLARWLASHRRMAFRFGLGLLALAFGLGKLNQTFLPNLYDYLHAGLATLTFACAAFGFLSIAGDSRVAPTSQRISGTRMSAASALILVMVFVLDVFTLDENLNVRVAMFDARSAASRAMLSGLDPVLRVWTQRNRRSGNSFGALLAREGAHGSLPTEPGAHVVLITIDALRADHLSGYGYTRPTSPELDRFAQGAVQFQRAYAQAPHSSYSLSSLHTSEYLHEVVELGRPLPKATLATTLAANGYHTAAFFTDGIFHTEGQRLAQYRDTAFGFALFDNTNRESEEQTDRVLAEVDRIKQQGEPPSFFWVHYFDVHEPYQETTFGSGELDRYDSEIKHVDRELARLLKLMEERLERELVVAITADHGEEFREHGGVYHGSTLYDEQVRVPLLLRVPGLAGAKVDAPVEVVDVAPTLLGAVGVPVPASMRGKDLRALSGKAGTNETAAFSAVLTKRMAMRWPHKVIADLRFGLYELYDLSQDPHERRNLASTEPEKLGEMRDLVYAWLDSLEHDKQPAVGAKTPGEGWDKALLWGRLGDRRAVEPMSKLILDTKAPVAIRVEAGQVLAKLADESCAPALVEALHTEPFEVSTEAAIALGRMYDPRARDALRRLIHVEDPFVRARAAVSLGRLRDPEAVPALIDALWVAPTQYEREEAVRWLGRLRDPRALEPLLSLLPEFGLRYLVTVALGQLGDPRAYDALAEMLRWETHTNIRDELIRGLGLLGDPRALPIVTDVLAQEPGLKNTPETLVRLDAVQKGYLGGTDLGPDTRDMRGFGACRAGPLLHDWDYLDRTTCQQLAPHAELKLSLPREHANWAAGAQLIIRLKRDAVPLSGSLALSMGGKPLATLEVDGSWREHRIDVPAELLTGSSARLSLEWTGDAPYTEVDHALLVPRSERLSASPELGTPNAAHHAPAVP